MSDLPDAAASGVTEPVGEERLEFRPLDGQDMGALERQVVQEWKRTYMRDARAIAEELPESMREQAIKDAWEKSISMSAEDLPEKTFDVPVRDDDKNIVKDAEGRTVTEKQRVPYAAWWMTSTFEGMMHMVWYSAKKARPELTYNDVASKISISDESDLQGLAEIVESISNTKKVGN